MKTNTLIEISAEVAWQLEQRLSLPRAEQRWLICDVVNWIVSEGIIDESSEDIDEIIGRFIKQNQLNIGKERVAK